MWFGNCLLLGFVNYVVILGNYKVDLKDLNKYVMDVLVKVSKSLIIYFEV